VSKKSEGNSEDLLRAIDDVRELAETSKAKLEDYVKEKPLESACFILMAGLLVGILMGASMSRRD